MNGSTLFGALEAASTYEAPDTVDRVGLFFYDGSSPVGISIVHNSSAGTSISLGATLTSTTGAFNVGSTFDVTGAAMFNSSVTTKGSVGGFVVKPRDNSGYDFQFYNATGDDMKVWNSNGGDVGGWLASNGDFYTNDGTVHSLSDARTKTRVKPFDAGLDAIKAIQSTLGVYRYRDDLTDVLTARSQREFIGVTAQSVQPWIPEAVDVGKDGYLTMTSTPFIYALMNAVVTLDARVKALEAQLAGGKQ
jgi:hypothetical protein